MAEGARYRSLVEAPEYTDQFESLAQIYSDEVIEDRLLGVLWGLATNAEQYERVTGHIRRARTKSFSDEEPDFDILFEIRDADTIGLLWIQETGGIDQLS
jgi:hypothetical protein